MAAVAVETIAAAALRARLRSHGRVAVRVQANGWDMLAGRVDGAAVEGRMWESPLGLTARILDVEVGRVELDLAAALQQQRIALRNVPLGAARVVFSGPDFGAFLQHPLVRAAAARAVQGLPFTFDREVLVLPPSISSVSGSSSGAGGGAGGAVLFSGVLPATQQRYQLTMRPERGGRAVTVTAVPVGAAAAAAPATAGLAARAGAAETAAVAAAAAAAVAGSLGSSGRGSGGSTATATATATAGAPLAPPAAGLSAASAGSVSAAGSSSSLASSSTDGASDPVSMVVSAELSRWFSRLMVDLQGAELAFEGLSISPAAAVAARDNAGVGGGGGGGAGGRGGGGGGVRLAARDAAEAWIDLRLKATVRDFPPLNLQF
ncbi:hypothetical protein HXX76_003063 [Chlamydomonas incerta]|uniref:Uncharacterized protein n=1 Tax=Chlamydomonas incerta TaxID=51695 RepID=A0A835W822_CHLIN|nr:hypothetical protein HXX76_003063 [Chlamydomonas incerta]|eukprot:KAG2442990.1 hypothetical protein HXX76_003063 [Chlamydomonas incerta]